MAGVVVPRHAAPAEVVPGDPARPEYHGTPTARTLSACLRGFETGATQGRGEEEEWVKGGEAEEWVKGGEEEVEEEEGEEEEDGERESGCGRGRGKSLSAESCGEAGSALAGVPRGGSLGALGRSPGRHYPASYFDPVMLSTADAPRPPACVFPAGGEGEERGEREGSLEEEADRGTRERGREEGLRRGLRGSALQWTEHSPEAEQGSRAEKGGVERVIGAERESGAGDSFLDEHSKTRRHLAKGEKSLSWIEGRKASNPGPSPSSSSPWRGSISPIQISSEDPRPSTSQGQEAGVRPSRRRLFSITRISSRSSSSGGNGGVDDAAALREHVLAHIRRGSTGTMPPCSAAMPPFSGAMPPSSRAGAGCTTAHPALGLSPPTPSSPLSPPSPTPPLFCSSSREFLDSVSISTW